MSDASKNQKVTVYLEPKLRKTVKYYAVQQDKSFSDLVNEVLFEYIENQHDLALLRERQKDADYITLEELTDLLKKDGVL